MDRYPIRLLFPAGRIVHLARTEGDGTLRTACGDTPAAGSTSPADGTVCRSCARRVGRTDGRYDRYPSAEAKFHALTAPTDDGHLLWTGPSDGSYPHLKFAGRRWAVRTLAFRLHYGRDPQGTVRTGCDNPGCLLGAHLDDTPARAAHRAAYAALGL